MHCILLLPAILLTVWGENPIPSSNGHPVGQIAMANCNTVAVVLIRLQNLQSTQVHPRDWVGSCDGSRGAPCTVLPAVTSDRLAVATGEGYWLRAGISTWPCPHGPVYYLVDCARIPLRDMFGDTAGAKPPYWCSEHSAEQLMIGAAKYL